MCSSATFSAEPRGWVRDSFHDRSLSRPTSDTAYSVLTDALPVGPRRCKKPRRQGLCDLCGLLGGVRAIETTRHLALECPYTTLTLEAVLRAVLESTTLDETVLEEVRGMGGARPHRE